MSRLRGISCLLVLAVSCLAAATTAASARASTQAKVSPNLKGIILKLGESCKKVPASQGVHDCGMGPYLYNYVMKSKMHRTAAVNQILALYQPMKALCATLRPNTSDKSLTSIQLDWQSTPDSVDFSCLWGRVGGKGPGVLVDIKLPAPGHKFDPLGCSYYLTQPCISVEGGVLVMPHWDDVTGYGDATTSTTKGFVNVHRMDVSRAAYNGHAAGDISTFSQIAAALGLPRVGE